MPCDRPPRYRVLALVLALATSSVACADRAERRPDGGMEPSTEELLGDIQRRTFDFFWETTNPANGLVPDRWPSRPFSSIAAVGFGLSAYLVGVERGWVTREAARDRVLTTLRFFRDAPQGPEAQGVTGYKGFYYHFLDMETGLRFRDTELSTVDTSLLMAGALSCREYFDRDDPGEREIRDTVDLLLSRMDWGFMQPRAPAVVMGWKPEAGFLEYDWIGYNEAMIVYLLALGQEGGAVDAAAWTRWTSRYDASWGDEYGQTHLGFRPHFGHQYSHVWVDFRGIRDAYMERKGLDYFENSRRATYASRANAMQNPLRWKDYGENIWGVTACDGPAEIVRAVGGQQRQFRGYAGRGWGLYDDGTIAPTGAIASIPFAPELAVPAAREMIRRYGDELYQKYGFLDAFNPTFTFTDVPLVNGKVVPDLGWIGGDYLGIDQGPILLMIENHRSELLWKVTRKSAYLRRGLTRAGFKGGWLEPD